PWSDSAIRHGIGPCVSRDRTRSVMVRFRLTARWATHSRVPSMTSQQHQLGGVHPVSDTEGDRLCCQLPSAFHPLGMLTYGVVRTATMATFSCAACGRGARPVSEDFW